MDFYDTLFDEMELKNRTRNLQKATSELDISFLFNRPDLFYYSQIGLDGIISVNNDELIRYVQRNQKLGKQYSSIPVKAMNSYRLFKEIAKKENCNTIGLELDILPYKTVRYIKKAFGNAEIVDISNNLREIRSIKSERELEYMRLAAKQTDESFEYIRDFIKPGVSELEISARIEYYLRRDGHPGYINVRMFQHNLTTLSYVMSGASTAVLNTKFGPLSGTGLCRMHMNGPSKRKIKNNETVVIDTTGVYQGYTADETITFFVGKPSEKLIDAYDASKSVHHLSEKLLIEGNNTADVYHKLMEHIDELGLSDNFMGYHGDTVAFIGHGIGLELDEFPLIAPSYSKPLKTGQVIAMEPKFIIDNSGAGIEQDYIVGKSKAERITKYNW